MPLNQVAIQIMMLAKSLSLQAGAMIRCRAEITEH